jgi:hypothetical protein
MTNGEQKMLWRGVAAGSLMGLAIGGMIALCVAMKPEFFAGLVQLLAFPKSPTTRSTPTAQRLAPLGPHRARCRRVSANVGLVQKTSLYEIGRGNLVSAGNGRCQG